MSDSDFELEQAAENVHTQSLSSAPNATNRVIKKFGGRHLIFRTTPSKFRVLPRPYVIISSFRGPVWMFYGLGQVWLTHKKFHEFGGWMARTPRVGAKEVTAIAESLQPELESFISYCNEHGVEGTILLEKKVIEFHWTFGFELEKEKSKCENAQNLQSEFEQLSARFAELI